MKPTFRSRGEPPGLVIRDPVQGRQFPLETPGPVEPRPSARDRFRFPVDAAATIDADRIDLPLVVSTYVRDADGDLVAEAEHFAYEDLPPGEYVVELMAPIKLYLRVEGALTVASSADHLRLDVDGDAPVEVGARSNHRRPPATVTTTDDPEDLLAAVSTFGAALKTTSPERSLPSLRGHPPRIERGDELRIPEGLAPPETGIRIELPPERAAVYAASTLAYYLGATVEPGPEPRLVADGVDRALGRPGRPLEEAARDVLERTFLLDCVARTEGLYRVDLHERRELDERVDVDWAALYEASPAERLRRYLSIPREAVADLVPTWRVATYATPAPANDRLLPFAVNGLSPIRTSAVRHAAAAPARERLGVDEFLRSADASRTRSDSPGAGRDRTADASYVSFPSTDALEVAWLGEERPIGANHLLEAGFENKLARARPGAGIDITVVCNDPAMAAEYDGADRSLYGERDELPFDVDVHYDLSREELADVLATDADFLHYVGHSESTAFVCRDGRVDAGDLDRVGPYAFLLNGCTSYEQGVRMLDGGSVGGIVTHSDVGNDDATAIGRSIARLLNAGFSLRAALEIARDRRAVGTQYVVVGDGGAQVAQNEAGTPVRYRIDSREDGRYDLRVETYPTLEAGMGAMYLPYLDGVDTHYLTGGPLPSFTVDATQLARFLRLEELPVLFDGERRWSSEIDVGR